MDQQIPKAVVQQRYERLLELQERISEEENARLVGTTQELLVQAGGGRKNDQTHRMSGRARDGRLVHFAPTPEIRPGDVVTVEITGSSPHFLIADGGVLSHRRTKAGDMYDAGRTPTTAPVGVGLGLPTVKKPGSEQENTPATSCGTGGCGCE